MRTKNAQNSGQTSLLELPTQDPAAALVWETKTITWRTPTGPETAEFYKARAKGHTFHVGLFPPDLISKTVEPPPSQWNCAHWQLHATFEPNGSIEFMSSLPGVRTKEEALELAAQRIRHFLQEQRRRYD